MAKCEVFGKDYEKRTMKAKIDHPAAVRKNRLIHEHYDEEGYFVRVNWKRED